MANEDHVRENVAAVGDFRPSLPDFHSGPPFVLRRSQQLLSAFYAAECRGAGINLTEPQLDALQIISLHDQPPDQTRLGLLLGYDRSTLSSIVDGLVRRKLVRRVVGGDRRRRTLVPMPATQAVLEKGLACSRQSVEHLLKGLSNADVAALLDVLEAVAMKQDTPAPPWHRGDRSSASRDAPDEAAVFRSVYRAPHFLMRRCLQIVGAYVAEAVAPLGLSSGLQVVVLYVVAACEPVDQARIGRILWIDKSSVSLVLNLLETAGLIRRSSHPTDQRRQLASITPAGREMLLTGVTGGHRVDEMTFKGLSPGTREDFTERLARVVAAHDGYGQ